MPVASHASCHGCSLCLVACPVWREKRDIRLTPHGRAKALQHGAGPAELAQSIASCTLCGSCEPACPERIPLMNLIVDLRRSSPLAGWQVDFAAMPAGDTAPRLLFPGRALRRDIARLVRIAVLLDLEIAADDGSDISLALEAGIPIPDSRRDALVRQVRAADRVVIGDGLLLWYLKDFVQKGRLASVGEALSAHEAVRARLRASDLYVVESRAYHADHPRLVRHYDSLRSDVGLSTNLDLHRLAVPTTASAMASADIAGQVRWITEGRRFDRIVVEDPGDCAAFASVTARPVVHVGDLV